MDGKAPEALSTPPSLVDDSESLGGTPRDSLCPDTPCFKSLTYAERQSADHASRLFPDDLVGDQRQGSGEVFCPPPKLSPVGIERSISPDELDSSDVESSVLDLDDYATMFSPYAEEPTMDQRAGPTQNSVVRDDQLLDSDSDDAPNCVPEKELCLSQLSSAHDREYAKGTSSSGTDPSLDVNVDSSSSELNKIDSPAAEQPWSGNDIASPTADEAIPDEDSAGPSEPPSDQRKPGRSKCEPSKKRNGSGVGSQRKKARLGLAEQLTEFVGCKISWQEIYRRFAGNCKSPDSPEILTNLFFLIACQEAFVQLKKAIPQLRGSMKISFSAKTVFDNLKSLEQVASNLTAGRIMQRHLLVELVEHRNQLENKYKPKNYRRAKMIREDKRRLERSDGLALDEMIREAYPTVIKGSDEYNKSRTTLRNNLSSGRNPHTLAHEFGRHILDLIPIGEGLGKSSITDNQWARVRHDDFKLFISVLKEKRGRFLRQCASCLDSFFDVSDDNSNCNRRYLLEDVDESSVTAERYDSSGLVDMLEMVVDDQRG
ncbi:hypothetical protein CNMCM6457_001789 [Aspergillus fumigatiaffinis]|nr:hypothetical protein CNMCM6457_001789 [Aspergillus fumigatiaffinis]